MQTQQVILDVLKPTGTIVDLSGSFNARVGDKMTPFQLFILEGGIAKDLKGMHPELEAVVGNGALKGNKAIMAAGAKGVHWVGSTNCVTGYNQLTLAFPAEVFPQSGFCYGHLILSNDAGVRESSVDIWFQVLDGTPQMGMVADHYDSELALELAKAKNMNDQFSQEMREAYNQQVTDAQNALTRATSDLSHLSESVGAVQAQIDAKNFVTLNKHRFDIEALSEMIEAKLNQMNLTPETFPNADELQKKYPNGKAGLFLTEDTGHKWIYWDNKWTDCGPYQGVGVADRSIDSAKLKQNALPLRTTQSAPWTVDFSARKLTVTDYSFLYDDDAHQVPVGDCSLPEFNTVYIGFDAAANTLNGYAHYYEMPRNSYFIGVVDFVTSQFFMQFDCFEAQNVPNGVAQYATKIKRQHLPAESAGLVSLLPWTVDTYGDKPTVTVNGYASYFTKNTPFTIAAGTYTFDKIESGAYYLYLDLDYKKFTATIKATSYQGNIPINDAYIGFIETNAHTYRIFENSNNLSYDFNLVTPGKFTVDFDEGILYVPVFWQTVNPLKIWSNSDSVAEIKFDKSQGALFVGIDPSQSDVQKMIVLDSNRQKIQDTYQYIGWISVNTQEYDFGKYGSTHDLATQPWINKKVACLGDSITEGDSGEGGLIDSYVPKLKKYIGTSAQNFGKSGALITKKTDDDISFVNRVGAIKGQDVVTIFGGINDFQWNAPLGTMADGIDKPTTFFGALKYVITTLAATNPKAKLMLITPMKTTKFQYHTYDSNGNLMQNANGNTQLDFVNAIKQVGEYYSIPVLDMYSNSNYSPYLPGQIGHDYFTVDGLHPTTHGYERIAQTIGHAINNL